MKWLRNFFKNLKYRFFKDETFMLLNYQSKGEKGFTEYAGVPLNLRDRLGRKVEIDWKRGLVWHGTAIPKEPPLYCICKERPHPEFSQENQYKWWSCTQCAGRIWHE